MSDPAKTKTGGLWARLFSVDSVVDSDEERGTTADAAAEQADVPAAQEPDAAELEIEEIAAPTAKQAAPVAPALARVLPAALWLRRAGRAVCRG